LVGSFIEGYIGGERRRRLDFVTFTSVGYNSTN